MSAPRQAKRRAPQGRTRQRPTLVRRRRAGIVSVVAAPVRRSARSELGGTYTRKRRADHTAPLSRRVLSTRRAVRGRPQAGQPAKPDRGACGPSPGTCREWTPRPAGAGHRPMGPPSPRAADGTVSAPGNAPEGTDWYPYQPRSRRREPSAPQQARAETSSGLTR